MEEKKTPPGALPDDPDPRPGVGPFSFAEDDLFAQPAASHDAEYLLEDRGENAMTREEADARFDRAVHLVAENYPYPRHSSGFARWWNHRRADVFSWAARTFGRFFW